MNNRQKEKEIQLRMARELNAQMEVKVRNGRVDLVTAEEVIEIKEWKSWKNGIGQLLMYAISFPSYKSLRLHCFGECSPSHKENVQRDMAELCPQIQLSYELD